ncbi:hypothetical protein PAXRUDRAFT_21934 [Paxillus rubicundulus Ve08.2h10]|uniref:Uncharacterized protein n=1 Tax=Paxillus rubicundulus Ve08.2h10 TaxID=930991 RepID=A0A0D0CNX1_9AGAM|nr:hypothetical protein PAXRUDRAFT_21934 [Paxillus rubicundulus Ve08.2h10]
MPLQCMYAGNRLIQVTSLWWMANIIYVRGSVISLGGWTRSVPSNAVPEVGLSPSLASANSYSESESGSNSRSPGYLVATASCHYSFPFLSLAVVLIPSSVWPRFGTRQRDLPLLELLKAVCLNLIFIDTDQLQLLVASRSRYAESI